MERLTQLEQESLEILKQLEHCCESAELDDAEKIKKRGYLAIAYFQIDFSVLKMPINIVAVGNYLRREGLDFRLILDFINDDPTVLTVSKDYFAMYTTLAEIHGKDANEIKTEIAKLIDKISSKVKNNSSPNITYYINNINSGVLEINGASVPFGTDTLEKTLLECTIDSYPKSVYWGDVSDKYDRVRKKGESALARRVRDTKDRINEKVKVEASIRYEIIEGKRGSYTLTKKVTKR